LRGRPRDAPVTSATCPSRGRCEALMPTLLLPLAAPRASPRRRDVPGREARIGSPIRFMSVTSTRPGPTSTTSEEAATTRAHSSQRTGDLGLQERGCAPPPRRASRRRWRRPGARRRDLQTGQHFHALGRGCQERWGTERSP
jgi:hypothetical protein